MRSVVLRLEGPMQSWGTQGRFGIRDTDAEPSKSGVIGLVGCALGMPRDDEATLARLGALAFAVRVDREGKALRDYHTIGGGRFRGDTDYEAWNSGGTTPTERHYLADACFTVALGGDDHGFVDAVAEAVQNPRWPLFLGRKSCVPSRPPFVSVVALAPDEAVRAAAAEPDLERPEAREARRMRLVLECEPGDGAVPRDDVPLSFKRYGRKHGRRFVRTAWVDVPAAAAGGAP